MYVGSNSRSSVEGLCDMPVSIHDLVVANGLLFHYLTNTVSTFRTVRRKERKARAEETVKA